MSIEDIKIFILVGGFGTRLRSVVDDVPKPMAPINNKPFLAYKIETIREYLPKNQIYLLTHYMSDYIKDYYSNDRSIHIIRESEPLGTGGSIKNAISILNLNSEDRLLITNGDTYIKPNYKAFVELDSNDILILAAYQKICDRYETLEITNGEVISFLGRKKGVQDSYINGGCYFFNDLSFFYEINDKVFSIEDKFRKYNNKKIRAFMYNGLFIDIGIPEDYKLMQTHMSKNEK
mgnify:FL=1